MKGLFIKDWKMVTQLGKLWLAVLAIVIAFTCLDADSPALIMFLPVFGTVLGLCTFSYDEGDNGMDFLLSLPFSRRDYVLEKYAFCIMMGGAGLMIVTAISMISGLATEGGVPEGTLMLLILALLAIVLLIDVMLPLQFIFGSGKSWMALLLFLCLVQLALFPVLERITIFEIDLQGMDTLIRAVAAAFVMLFISFGISISVIKRKEF